jgi:hypothetical protein
MCNQPPGSAGDSWLISNGRSKKILYFLKQILSQNLDLFRSSQANPIEQVGKQHTHVAFDFDQTFAVGGILPFLAYT